MRGAVRGLSFCIPLCHLGPLCHALQCAGLWSLTTSHLLLPALVASGSGEALTALQMEGENGQTSVHDREATQGS